MSDQDNQPSDLLEDADSSSEPVEPAVGGTPLGDIQGLLVFIREAIKAHAIAKLALVLVGFGAAGAILLFFFKTPLNAGGILLGMMGLSVALLILIAVAKSDNKIFRIPAIAILWSVTICLVVLMFSGVSSLISGWPVKAWQYGSDAPGLTQEQLAQIKACDDKVENPFAQLACYQNLPFKDQKVVQDKIASLSKELENPTQSKRNP